MSDDEFNDKEDEEFFFNKQLDFDNHLQKSKMKSTKETSRQVIELKHLSKLKSDRRFDGLLSEDINAYRGERMAEVESTISDMSNKYQLRKLVRATNALSNNPSVYH